MAAKKRQEGEPPGEPDHREKSWKSAESKGAELCGVTNPLSFQDTTIEQLEQFALGLPEAWADSPWGDRVVKVAKKIFVFLSSPDAERPGLTVKLPDSHDHALSFEGSILPGYGLGKHGWVTIYVDGVPKQEREVLFDFVEESYRTVAPKTLVKRLDAQIAAQE